MGDAGSERWFMKSENVKCDLLLVTFQSIAVNFVELLSLIIMEAFLDAVSASICNLESTSGKEEHLLHSIAIVNLGFPSKEFHQPEGGECAAPFSPWVKTDITPGKACCIFLICVLSRNR